MASGYEDVMVEALNRLKATPALAPLVRRAHRTTVPRETGNAVHLLDGQDRPKDGKSICERQGEFTVSLLVRSDAGASAADPLKIEVMRRLAEPWPDGAIVKPGRISVDQEIGDKDPARVDMEFSCCYPAAEWSLGGT